MWQIRRENVSINRMPTDAGGTLAHCSFRPLFIRLRPNMVRHYWKPGVVNNVGISDDKVGIMTTYGEHCQWRQSWHHDNMSTLSSPASPHVVVMATYCAINVEISWRYYFIDTSTWSLQWPFISRPHANDKGRHLSGHGSIRLKPFFHKLLKNLYLYVDISLARLYCKLN